MRDGRNKIFNLLKNSIECNIFDNVHTNFIIHVN
jgi:hypothetical protein